MRKWECYGVETAASRAEFAKKNYDLEVSNELFESGEIKPSTYAVITLFHVLEHIEAPKQLICNLLSDNLARNGLLIIEVPNFESFQSKIAGPNWLHLDLPRHINHFTKARLFKMMEDIGLNVETIEYYDVIHGTLGMLNSLFSLFGYRKNLMSELKYRRKANLLFSIFLLLPLAFLLEIISAWLKKGAILRVFCVNSK